MRLSRWMWAVPVVGAAGVGVVASLTVPQAGAVGKNDGDPKQVVSLPVKQVVLFNSGVGYFGRTGEVTGEARVDLTFQESDINDLLKSMTLQDFGGGHISAVSYDSREPISRTLSSFAINLNGEPTLAAILTQARGEQVEVVLNTTVTTQPGTIKGQIVGHELQKVAVGTAQIDCTVLNIHTTEGFRAVKMMDIQRVRFLNPVLEAELKRALETVALSHDSAKKAVSIQFSGDGNRKVKVGYVVEAPVWKTSYRLVLDKDDAPYLQGWAIVENPTDEDWQGVMMGLVSGRPISFKMDLYNPLFVPRPTVEPELFASLRPPAYDGGFRGRETDKLATRPAMPVPLPAPTAAAPGPGGPGGFGGPAEPKKADGKFGMPADRAPNREFEKQMADEMARKFEAGAVGSSATASKLGDNFQYGIKHPVSLARQKSALLPIVTEKVEGQRVSIYNPAVQGKHPLLGFRLKNSTKATLPQGPITVLDNGVYAGDSRITDVQVNDERLLAYAIDLATEVIPQNGPGTTAITSVKATKGIVHITRRVREERVYKIENKGDTDRTLLIEHPNRTNQQFKLVDTAKPQEETAALFRFETKVAAKQSAEFKVKEERDLGDDVVLTNSPDDTMRFVMNLNEASAKLKEQLKVALTKKGEWDAARRELAQVVADIARITADQDRIRKNLRETPEAAEVYKKYLKKLDDQEKELDTLTDKQKKLMADEFKAKKTYEEFLGGLSD